jgi:hypothetical protein
MRRPNEAFDIQLVTQELLVDEVIAAQKKLYLDAEHDSSRSVLWDARSAEVNSGITELLAMVEHSTDLWAKMSGGKTAILVSNAEHASTARTYRQLASAMPRELSVFTSYGEAINWLTAQSTPEALSKAS